MEIKKREDGTYELDVRGYEGPHLDLYICNALDKLKAGSLLEVFYDDPGSQEDFEMAFNEHGHEIIDRHSGDGEFRITIKKG
jgi:TusA-related sulfurtransferase